MMDIKKIISDAELDPSSSEDINRIDPKVMTAIMAMAQTGQITKIRENLEDRISRGWAQSFNPLVTNASPGDGFRLDQLAQSVSITNDGPNTVLIGFNNFKNPHSLLITEILTMNFEAHVLDRIYWQSLGTSALRVIVKG